jgi:hypothetical protein
MAGGLLCRKTALAKSGDRGPWVLGTLYVHDDDIRFEPHTRRPVDVSTHLTWPAVLEVGCSKTGLFRGVQITHRGGVEVYRCFGAKRFAEALESVRARSRVSRPRRSVAVALGTPGGFLAA